MANRLYQPPSDQIPGNNPQAWPAALNPVSPLGRNGSQPLSIPFWEGINLNYTVRSDSKFKPEDLQLLAAYPLARICIDNTKDVLGKIPWKIQPKVKFGESREAHSKRSQGDQTVLALSRFFEYPDGENNWSEWLRLINEDMLVLDAPAVQICRLRNKKVVKLRVLPGEDITRYVDDNGDMPQEGPAFAQLWQGIPRINLTADQLVYRPRNYFHRKGVIASYLFGYGPTEAMALHIQIGIQRLLFVLAYYTQGSIPDFIHVIPGGADNKEVKTAFEYTNSVLKGQLDKRRGYIPIQGFTPDGKDQFLFPKEKLLADAFDDLHIRYLCYGYGCSPQRLLRMLNRATGEANQDAAEDEGVDPFRQFDQDFVNYIIQRRMGFPDYEMVLSSKHDTDAVNQATADASDVGSALIRINEIRERRGLDPDPNPLANQLLMKTVNGLVALGTPPPVPGGGGGPEPTAGAPKPKPAAASGKSLWEETMQKGIESLAVRAKSAAFGVLTKYSEEQPRVPAGGAGGGEFASPGATGGKQRSEKALRALKNFVPTTKADHAKAELQEQRLARGLGLERTGDNQPFDLVGNKVAVELKTLISNTNDKITMRKDALQRKVEAAKSMKAKMYTVVADARAGSTKYFVREGVGSFRLSSMTQTTLNELKLILKK